MRGFVVTLCSFLRCSLSPRGPGENTIKQCIQIQYRTKMSTNLHTHDNFSTFRTGTFKMRSFVLLNARTPKKERYSIMKPNNTVLQC